MLKLACERGYGNAFTAIHATLPWRPQLLDDSGARLNPRPTAPGPMSAIVVGPDGQTTANGADELWCDALVRIKIGFHWRLLAAPETSTWLSEKTWGEKGIEDALAEFMENKRFS